MTGINEQSAALRISDADRNGTLRRLHNAVALGLIDIDEFEERSARVSQARLRSDLDELVGDLPGPGALVTSAADRVELRGWAGSLKRHGEWTVPTRLALVRRMGSVDLDLTRARFAGPMVMVELDMKFGSVDIRLPDGASASIDDVEVIVGSAERPPQGCAGRRDTARDPDRSRRLRLGGYPRPAQVVVRPRTRLTASSTVRQRYHTRYRFRDSLHASRTASRDQLATVQHSEAQCRTCRDAVAADIGDINGDHREALAGAHHLATARAGPSTIGARKCTFMSAVVTSCAGPTWRPASRPAAMSIKVATSPPCRAPRMLVRSGLLSISMIRHSSFSTTSRMPICFSRCTRSLVAGVCSLSMPIR